MNCPQTLTEGVSVPVVCTIKYTCVKTPPQLMWSYSKGSINAIHEPEQGGVWEVKSVLTFIPASEDHSQTLQCRALYSDINDLISPGPSCKLHVQCKWFLMWFDYSKPESKQSSSCKLRGQRRLNKVQLHTERSSLAQPTLTQEQGTGCIWTCFCVWTS